MLLAVPPARGWIEFRRWVFTPVLCHELSNKFVVFAKRYSKFLNHGPGFALLSKSFLAQPFDLGLQLP